jgi:hypothetical protein
MPKKKPNYYAEALLILKELQGMYPSYSLGTHIATAFEGYADLWGVSDKEAVYALTKYKASLEMDVPHETNDEEVQKIIDEGMKLGHLSLLTDEDFDN